MSNTPAADPSVDPRFVAARELLRSTGAAVVIDLVDDVDPHFWYAHGQWSHPVVGNRRAEVVAALHPLHALFRLCEAVFTGTRCVNCGRATIFVPEESEPWAHLLAERDACRFTFHAHRKVFVRTCQFTA